MQFQLTLEENETNLVLGALAKLPIENALDTWFKIRNQAQQQVQAAQAQQAQPQSLQDKKVPAEPDVA